MQCSSVNKSELNEEFRVDSEYYSPENLKKEDAVTNHKYELLGNLCELIAGPFGSAVTTERYDPDSGKRYIRGKDIQSFFLEKNDAVYVEKDLYHKLPQFHLKELDILLTVVGMKFGKVAIIYNDDLPAIFSCKSTLIRNPRINVWYLLAYLTCDVGYGLIRRGQRGAAQPGINLYDIQTVPVPLFGAVLELKIEGAIKAAKNISGKSVELFDEAQTILLSELGLTRWHPKHQISFVKNFSDTEQIGRIDAEYYQPKYEKIIKAIKAYHGGWDTLGNLVSVKKCVEVGSSEYLDEGIPFVRVSNLSTFEISEEKYISANLYAELQKHQPKKGEILFSKDATPGIAYHLNEKPRKMIPSGGILRLKSKTDKVNNEYLVLVLNSTLTKEQINRDVGGSVILHWRPDQVKETVIPILSEDKQTEIQQKVIESFNLRKQSKHLLECAKLAVEIAIEKNEQKAIAWLEEQAEISGVTNAI